MSPVNLKTFILPKLLSIFAGLILLSAASWYFLFQARYLISGPQITLLNKPDAVQNERQITLRGLASNITEIYLNGRAIVTNEDGVFSENVVLENGYTIVRIDAVDLYGRETHEEWPFVYKVYKEDGPGLTLSDKDGGRAGENSF